MPHRPPLLIFLAAALAASPASSEVFFSETVANLVKIEVIDGVEINRWEYPKEKASRPIVGEHFENSLGQLMVWIPSGRFFRGSSKGSDPRVRDEGPRRQVTIRSGFWSAAHELTQGQYEILGFRSQSRFIAPDRPVERITWEEATQAAATLTEREQAAGSLPRGWRYGLPTETQWEYMARAGTEDQTWAGPLRPRAECYSETLEAIAWYCGNSSTGDRADHNASRWGPRRGASRGHIGTHPVGMKRPNPWGLYDMFGNVSEWCLDNYFPDYAGAPEGERAQGAPEIPGARVHRGGSWSSLATECRAARRRHLPQDLRTAQVGVRLVLVKP